VLAHTLAQERRQIAADVHDLIMQDLSLALSYARSLARGQGDGSRAELAVGAGERALNGARTLVGDLNQQATHDREPIVQAVQTSAQTAARSRRLIFDAAGVPRFASADGPTRAALVHVAREAVTNAAKHANPSMIEVVLRYRGGWRLTVRYEGAGFDAGAANGGFGLTSMRAHAQALGGALHVMSAAERGTTVEVLLP
jgi:signal transduction histidine kinase